MPAIGIPDLLQQIRQPSATQFFRDAKAKKRTLSAYLTDLVEVDDKDRSAGIDGFTLLMEEAGVIARSIPSEGIYADTLEDFVGRAGRALFVEWGWRQYRAAQGAYGSVTQQRAAASTDFTAGSPMRPYADSAMLAQDAFQPAIPIGEVISSERGLTTNVFRKMVLTEPTASQKRLVRVGELAEIPKTQLTVGATTINMYKFARGLEISDEATRRESMDRIATMVQLMAVQNDIDKLAAIIDVMVNGDEGGGNAATNYNLTSLDASTTANNLTVKAWLSFLGKWKNPYIMTHALARESGALAIKLLNTGSANLPTSTIPGGWVSSVRPINRNLPQTIGLGETDDAPANVIVGFDRRVAIERLFEIGADTQETERYVSRQAEAVFFSEVEGYQVPNRNAAKTLTLNA